MKKLPAICVSQSRPDARPQRDGIRLQVLVRNTTLPATVRLRFLTAADSVNGVGRLVSVPYDQTFSTEQLRVRIEPTDPRARVQVAVERWREGALEDQGSVTGKAVLVQVQRDVLRLAAGPLHWTIWPVDIHVF
jgi:hypothetical protein